MVAMVMLLKVALAISSISPNTVDNARPAGVRSPRSGACTWGPSSSKR